MPCIILNALFYFLLCWVSLCWVSLCWVPLCWMSRFIYFKAECHYAEMNYAEGHYAECGGAWCPTRKCKTGLKLLFWIFNDIPKKFYMTNSMAWTVTKFRPSYDDRHKWRLYYNCVLALALAIASVTIYNHKWSNNLEHHLLTTLESSFTIVICLWYRPQKSADTRNKNAGTVMTETPEASFTKLFSGRGSISIMVS